jgi:hypothetical protein
VSTAIGFWGDLTVTVLVDRLLADVAYAGAALATAMTGAVQTSAPALSSWRRSGCGAGMPVPQCSTEKA